MVKYLQSNIVQDMWPIKAFSFPSFYSEKKKKNLNEESREHLLSHKRTQKVDALIFLRNQSCFTLQWLKRGLWKQTNLGFIPF